MKFSGSKRTKDDAAFPFFRSFDQTVMIVRLTVSRVPSHYYDSPVIAPELTGVSLGLRRAGPRCDHKKKKKLVRPPSPLPVRFAGHVQRLRQEDQVKSLQGFKMHFFNSYLG